MAFGELGGVRVLEYGPWINVCYAGKMFADLGADVVRIESPLGDDQVRVYGPFPGDDPETELSGLHLYLNCNKRGVTLDPSTPAGQEVFRGLCEWADVLIEWSDPGFLSGLGLDYPSLAEVNPRLIMVSISSLGRSGPYAGYRGSGLISWQGSGSGHMYLGDPEREPISGIWDQGSHWGAFNAAAAASLALHARDKTGRGQWIDASEAEALSHLLNAVEVSDFHDKGATKSRAGAVGLVHHVPRTMNRCKDGWVALQAISADKWEGLVSAMGNPEWAQSELFKGTSLQRSVYAEEIQALMDEWLLSHTPREIFQLCQAEMVPAAPLNTVADLCSDEHLHVRGYFMDVEHPAAGTLRLPGAPYDIGKGAWKVVRPAPMLGQHNEEVYVGILGRPREDLRELRYSGAI